jgi:hypothetical protein
MGIFMSAISSPRKKSNLFGGLNAGFLLADGSNV